MFNQIWTGIWKTILKLDFLKFYVNVDFLWSVISFHANSYSKCSIKYFSPCFVKKSENILFTRRVMIVHKKLHLDSLKKEFLFLFYYSTPGPFLWTHPTIIYVTITTIKHVNNSKIKFVFFLQNQRKGENSKNLSST